MLNQWLSSLPPEVTELLGYSRLAGALLIVLVGLLAARLVQAVVKGLLLRLAAKTKSHLDEDILHLIHQPLRQTVLLISAGLAVVWLRPGQRPQYLLVGLIETTIVAIWLVAMMRLTTLIFGEIGRRLTEARKGGADLIPLLANIMRVLVITAAAFAVLTIWEVDYHSAFGLSRHRRSGRGPGRQRHSGQFLRRDQRLYGSALQNRGLYQPVFRGKGRSGGYRYPQYPHPDP